MPLPCSKSSSCFPKAKSSQWPIKSYMPEAQVTTGTWSPSLPCSLCSEYSVLYTCPSIIPEALHPPLRYSRLIPSSSPAFAQMSHSPWVLSALPIYIATPSLPVLVYSLALTTIYYSLYLPICLLYFLSSQPSPPALQGCKLPNGKDFCLFWLNMVSYYVSIFWQSAGSSTRKSFSVSECNEFLKAMIIERFSGFSFCNFIISNISRIVLIRCFFHTTICKTSLNCLHSQEHKTLPA